MMLLVSTAIAGPLDTWTVRSDSTTPVLQDVVFGDGKFVAVGQGFSVSADGRNWSHKPPLVGIPNVTSVAFGNGRFVSVGGTSAFVSEDGTNWIVRGVSSVSGFNSITFGNGKFIAVGASGVIAISTDGEFWSTVRSEQGDLSFATYAGGMFFWSSLTSGKTHTSFDGFEWLEASPISLWDVATIGERFFSARNQQSSLSGTNWTQSGNGSSFTLVSMSSMPGMLIGVNNGLVWNSVDGTNWISRATGLATANYLYGVAFGHGVAVAVGATPTGKGLIIASGEIPPPSTTSLSLAFYPGISVSGGIARTYRIDAADSPESANWDAVGQITLTKSPQIWFDENSLGQPKKFYRAILIP